MKSIFKLQKPDVQVVSEFLSDDECHQIVKVAEPKMVRSTGLSAITGAFEVTETRTSSGCFISNAELHFLNELDARIKAQFGMIAVNGEWLQVLRYEVGQEYRPHFDFFDPNDAGAQVQIARGGNRIATLLLYLNTPEVGGETTFPDAGLEVSALKGNALFFKYDMPSSTTLTRHGGAPVISGVKYVGTKWYRQNEFR